MALTDKLTTIADAIRSKTGGTEALTLDGMAEAVAGISAGGCSSIEDGIITRTITEYSNNRVTSIGEYAFSGCSSLEAADLPLVTSIGKYAFSGCSSLEAADFPLITSIGEYAFYNCSNLATADFPLVTSIGAYAFYNCSNLATADFPLITSIGEYAFYNCSNLATADFPLVTSIGISAFSGCSSLEAADLPLVTRIGKYAFSSCEKLSKFVIEQADSVCTLDNTNAFRSTSIAKGTGYIYVPDALVEDYKAATNWATYADQIKPLSEYTG